MCIHPIILLVTVFVTLSTSFTAFGVAPKIGTTVSFNRSHERYSANSFFKERPVTVEMAKSGIDLCWYFGWDAKEDSLKSLKQFNAVWLITEHEDECPYTAEETVTALKEYVEAGGGIVFCFSPGRYPEAPVDAYWTKVMNSFGAEILHEEIFNKETEVQVDSVRNMFHTDSIMRHPVTENVRGLWLADRSGGTWGSAAVKYSPDWQIVATGGKGSRSVPKNRRTNEIQHDKEGFYKTDVPIVAVRTFGRGRIVFIASHKDTVGWMYNIDRWPNFTERSNYNGKPSDMLTLVQNALRWAAEPSKDDESFVKHYKPVEPVIPPYKPQLDFGLRELEKKSYNKNFAAGVRVRGARGLVGVRSSYSDGESTVAEYVAAAKAAGLNFLIFADPLEKLTAEKLAALREDCSKNSTEDFYCCPGIEYIDSSDLVWALWHDEVEFPDPKPFVKDGRTYTLFDGKRILQRNGFGGHQNLYRGALLNMEKLLENGNEFMNLAYFNAITPKVFDVDSLTWDNYPHYLKIGHTLHRAATVSYTRVKRASDVARAAKTAVTCGDNLQRVRKWANAKGGWNGQEAGAAANLQAVYGGGVEIDDFKLARMEGTDIYRIAFGVSCTAGVKEVKVLDGNRRVLGRFLANGEKSFKRTFDYLHDRQSVLILEAYGNDGSHVVSNSRWILYYHAGMFRCGDNSNLLSQNPACIVFPNWDDVLTPPFKHIGTLPKHGHVSEAHLWAAINKIPSREPNASCRGEYSRIYLKGSEYPGEKTGFPSSHTCSTLNAPNVVSIFDHDIGQFIMEPTRSEKNATYAICSPVKKISEGRYWRRHHRVYQFVDRHDGWWRAVHKRLSPYYRGGYTIVEGEIDFTEDAELARPIELLRIRASNPSRPVDVFERDSDKFKAGSYYALHSLDTKWYGLFGLKGSDELHIIEENHNNAKVALLCLGKTGCKVKAGDKWRYRLAVASFVENPRNGQYCEWFARMMDGTGFNHDDAPVNGIVELTAKDNLAECTFGSTWFIQNYPVRIKGLVDNGCAIMTDGDKIHRPLAFDGDIAYASVPLEIRKKWKFLNLFVADDPSLRLTYVPAMPGHENATLQIQNFKNSDVTTRIKNILTQETFDVSLPRGGMTTQEITATP